MLVYGAIPTEYLEEKGFYFLQKVPGYENIKRNNLEVKTAPDYSNGLQLGDCQYSAEYDVWGDLRCDTISAYLPSEYYKTLQEKAIIKVRDFKGNSYESFLHSLVKIKKLGKIFDDIDFILYFVFGHKVNPKRLADVQCSPRKIYVLDVKEFKKLLEINWKRWIAMKCLKFNKKSNISDNFGSAFTALKPALLSSCLTDLTKLYNEV